MPYFSPETSVHRGPHVPPKELSHLTLIFPSFAEFSLHTFMCGTVIYNWRLFKTLFKPLLTAVSPALFTVCGVFLLYTVIVSAQCLRYDRRSRIKNHKPSLWSCMVSNYSIQARHASWAVNYLYQYISYLYKVQQDLCLLWV